MRCLIIGCGCRGQSLSRELVRRGYAVRGTTRRADRLPDIQASGAEALLGDPDRVSTLVGAFEHATIACILLGSAVGSAEELRALHGTRLEMLLTKLVDTTVRGVVYEATGTVDPDVLAGGVERIRGFGERSLASCALVRADPDDPRTWLADAVQAVEQTIAPR